MSISTTIKTIQDIMRKDAGVDGDAQRISQLVWMIFLKIFDDREQEYELLEEDYHSPVPERLRWRSWAADDEGITGDTLLNFVNNDLFPTLKELALDPQRDRRGLIVREAFQDAYNYMKNGTLMRQVINKIGVFNPYTGIKTNLLFFTKGRPTREIWFYEHPYPPGYKSYSKTKPIRIEEFEPEKSWWDQRVESEYAWRVPVEEIRERGYNLDIKNPHQIDEEHLDPEHLLASYRSLLAEVAEAREALRRELAASLERSS